MRKQTQQKLLGLLDSCTRKIQRAQKAGTRAAFIAVAQHAALIANVVRAELKPREQQEPLQVLGGVEQALNALPAAPDAALCQETAALLQELTAHLRQQVAQARTKKLIVFLPYKASMWDSLESIWMAADKDREHCQAMVVPIPYADRNPDGTAAQWHYEIGLYPKYVPVIDHNSVDLEKLHPDVIFIHNPYDNYNAVTSVDMQYYSFRLKQYTDCLIYVPYYVTAGGMGEFQRTMEAYKHVDYIVAQSPAGVPYYDEQIQDKVLPLGSPKLDRVVQICSHPPKPPVDWQKKMAGRKVFFYNTSLNGMLSDPERFLKKMQYVFRVFRQHPEACLLWRPHPLFWYTLRSMLPKYLPRFEALRDQFTAENIGILDTTPDIEQTMALSDVYIGDSGTSVTALFGAAGKPVFVMNNLLSTAPAKADWRSAVLPAYPCGNDLDRWFISLDNALWHREEDGDFHFYCRLSPYHSAGYFGAVIECRGKVYVLPYNAQEILVVAERRIVRRIPLRDARMPYPGRFAAALTDGNPAQQRYIFLQPLRYPYLVRLDTETDEVTYVQHVQQKMAVETDRSIWMAGGWCYQDGKVYLASPVNGELLILDAATLEMTKTMLPGEQSGTKMISYDASDDALWLLPMIGTKVQQLSLRDGTLTSYDAHVDGLACWHPILEQECRALPFQQALRVGEFVLLTPFWGNKFVLLNKETGRAEEWQAPPEIAAAEPNPYYNTYGWPGMFTLPLDEDHWQYYNARTRRLYCVDIPHATCEELPLHLAQAEVLQHAAGFSRLSEWLQFGCEENAMQTLAGLLDGSLPGAAFDVRAERQAYDEVAANIGHCGEKIYDWLREHWAQTEA